MEEAEWAKLESSQTWGSGHAWSMRSSLRCILKQEVLGQFQVVSQDIKTWKDERGSLNSESHKDGGEREEMV